MLCNIFGNIQTLSTVWLPYQFYFVSFTDFKQRADMARAAAHNQQIASTAACNLKIVRLSTHWLTFQNQLTELQLAGSHVCKSLVRIFGSLNCEPSKRVLFSSNPNLKNLRSNSIKIGANSKEQLLKKIIKFFFNKRFLYFQHRQ